VLVKLLVVVAVIGIQVHAPFVGIQFVKLQRERMWVAAVLIVREKVLGVIWMNNVQQDMSVHLVISVLSLPILSVGPIVHVRMENFVVML
tara:strand:- start:346 stop:615 length:270 start_codon:yes stop_codon:yes gene_type:complete